MRHVHTVRVGPYGFRVGSDWRAPIAALERLYAGYPKPDGVADFTVRLEATRPWRRVVRPSVRLAGDWMLPEAAPLPLAHALLAAEMGMNLQMALGVAGRRQGRSGSVSLDAGPGADKGRTNPVRFPPQIWTKLGPGLGKKDVRPGQLSTCGGPLEAYFVRSDTYGQRLSTCGGPLEVPL